MADTIRGLTDEQLTDYEQRAEQAMLTALESVMGRIAEHLGATRTAAALVAAGPESVSPDDLAGITPLWSQAVQDDLLPVVAEVYQDAAGTVHAQLIDATDLPSIPPVTSLASEAYLAQAANTFEEVGADLWEIARGELLDGFQQGESIPELRDRLRNSAGLTGRTATLVARTQVLDASNAGSYDTARVSGLDLLKGWEATPDARTRDTHSAAGAFYQGDGMIALNGKFVVGGFQCDRPHDPSLPPAERYNCRCTLIYAMAPAVPTPPKDRSAEIEAWHAQRLAQVKALHDQRLGEAAERHARKLADLDAADAAETVVQAAQTRHAARLAKLNAAFEARRVALAEERARRLGEQVARPKPLPSAVSPEPPSGVPSPVGPTPVPVRATLTQAESIPEVKAAFVREWQAILDQRRPRLIASPSVRFIPDGDVQTAREHAEGLLRALERFPRVPMAVSHRSMRHYAQADLDSMTIQFGNGFARDRAAYLASLRQSGTPMGTMQGYRVPDVGGIAWHPMSTASPQGVAIHEFGHLLHHMLSPLEPDPTVPGVLVFRYSTKVDDAVKAIVRDLATDRGVPADELIKREIGEYAATNTHELIGEAFADAMVNGDAASVLSRRIMAMLVDEYDQTVSRGRLPRGGPPAGTVLPSTPRPEPVQVRPRPSLVAATSTDEINTAFLAEWQRAVQGLPQRRRPTIRPPMVRFGGDLDTAREHAEGLLRSVEQFPAVRLKIGRDPVGAEYASTEGTFITFVDTWAANRPAYLANLAQSAARRWHPPSISSPAGVASHEFAHALIYTVAPKLASPAKFRALVARIEATVRAYAAERGLPMDEVIKAEVSEWGALGTGRAGSAMEELAAEAFAQVLLEGDAAPVLARRVFALLVDEYDRAVGPGRARPSLGRVLPPAPAPVQIAERIREINKVPTTAPRQLRIRITAELERQAQVNPAVLAEIRRIEIATQDTWDAMARRGLIDPNGFAAYHYTDHILYLSPRWAADRAALDRTIKGAFEQDNLAWSFPGYEMRDIDTAASVIRHEFGHITASRFPNEALGEIWTPQQIRQLVVPIAEELGVAPPLDTVTSVAEWFNSELVQRAVRTRVSGYATKSFNELTAELWAVYSGRGTAASAIARRIGAILEARWAGLTAPAVPVEPGLARGVAEALQALTTGRTITEVRALLEALPEAKDALKVARRATSTEALTRSLNALATRRGLTLPSAKELKAIQAAERAALVAERKAARAAAAEAARVARAEKARQAAVKRQVKAIEQGEFQHLTLIEKHAGGASYTDPAGGRWMVETFTSETDARERALYASLQDLVTRDAADPPLRFAIGRGAPELRGGWQVAYPDIAAPLPGVGPADWLAVPLARLQAVTPAKIKALVAKAGLPPDMADRHIAERAATIVQGRLLARRMPSRNAPLLTDVQALDQATFAQQAKWIDGIYGTGGLRAKVTDFFVSRYTGTGGQPIEFRGEIFLRGKRVGSFKRDYRIDGNGDWYAHHAYLQIDSGVQGSGFAEAFNANLIDWYRRSGIKQVRLSANIDVGGYAWARAGYEFADQAAADDITARLTAILGDLSAGVRTSRFMSPNVQTAWMQLDPTEVQAQIRAAQALLVRARQHPRFDDPLHPSAYEFSQLGRHAGQGKDDIWIGKATMLGSYWSAVLYL